MSLGGIALATDFALLIVAATVLSYVARLTKQPTIVAYILTGVIVGPIGLGLIAEEDALIEIVSELGLGFLLFLLGIEMRFDDIREIVRPVGTIAVGQAILQAIASTGVALVLGFTVFQSLMIALATTFGATPIIVKVLGDKDDLKALYGKVDVGILIFQDIYLVMALAILAVGTVEPVELATSLARVFVLMGAIGVVAYLASQYFLPALLRASAANKSTLFTVGIAWAFVFIFAAETLELSIEIGAFLAGLALAQLPYSTELKERMRPATNFFIAVFFASIALQMEVDQLLAYWQEALIAATLLIVINFCIVFGLFYSQRFDVETSFLGTVSMLQVSEFSLVLGALAVDAELIEGELLGFLSLMALITMPLSTYYVIYNRQLYAFVEPYLERLEREDTVTAQPVEYEDHAVIVGYSRLTGELADVLRDAVDEVVFVEDRAEYVEELTAAEDGFIFGNARHGDIRQDANVTGAEVVVSAAERTDVNRRLVEDAPDALTIVAATTEAEAAVLRESGADYVVVGQGLVGEELAALLEDLDEPGAFERRLEKLNDRALNGSPRVTESAADGGGTDV